MFCELRAVVIMLRSNCDSTHALSSMGSADDWGSAADMTLV